MPEKDYNFNFPRSYSGYSGLDGQVPHIDVVMTAKMTSFKTWPNRFLSVNLTGTRVSADGVHNPPRMASNSRDHQGWYTESVLVKMWMSESATSSWTGDAPTETASGILRKNDGPVTTGGSVQVSSGTSTSVGANAGMMGEAPMVGISGGITESSSFSESIPHFSIVNNSNENSVSQLFHLTSSNGGGYSNGGSLVHRSDAFHQTSLYTLPEKAIAGLPVNSQAIFMTPADYAKAVFLHLRIEHTIVNVHTSKSGLGDLDSHTTWTNKVFHNVDSPKFDFSEVDY